jgi:hypothetical protein
MNKVIIFRNENGSVSLCSPTGEITVEQVQAKDIPAGITSYIVTTDTLPEADNDFFDAWVMPEPGIVAVDLGRAKEITKNRLRIEREPLFVALDVAFQRAIEAGSDTSAIVAEKQRLRDITNLVYPCTTTAELRALKVTA